MKSEIRGIKAGRYYSPCESVLLQLRISDEGVIVEIADSDADIFYAFTIDNEEVVKFEVDELAAAQGE